MPGTRCHQEKLGMRAIGRNSASGLYRDFRQAFGREPPETVEVIALFTDNDQTREPVETYYGAVHAVTRITVM